MDGLKELFDAIRESGNPVEVIVDPDNPAVAHYWNPKEGTIHKFEVEPPPRRHVCSTVESFIDAVQRYAIGGLAEHAAIWVSVHLAEGEIVLIINDAEGHRNDRVTLGVRPSPLFASINRGVIRATQNAVLKWLSHDVFAAVTDPEGFQLAISSLVWHIEDTEHGNLGNVKSTMGRQINAEAKSEKPLPTQVTFHFNPFPSIVLRGEEADSPPVQAVSDVSVKCTVIVEPEEKRISILPLPGAVDLALVDALNGLAQFIRDELQSPHPQVLCGVP